MVTGLVRVGRIDYAMRMQFDPERKWHVTLSRQKRYDPIEFNLAHGLLEWNNGAALDPTSAPARARDKPHISAAAGCHRTLSYLVFRSVCATCARWRSAP